MKQINSVQQGVASGSIARLPRPVDFPAGRGCSRIRAEFTIPVKNNTAGALNYTGARAKKAIECVAKTSHLKFGDRVQDNVDVALDFKRLRELTLELTGDDFLIIGSDNVPRRMKDVADADVLFAAVAAGATVNLVVEIVRPFEVVRLAEDAYAYCPGATQMRQIQWEFQRGGAADFDTNGDFVAPSAADVMFLADDFEASDDKWTAVPRLYLQEEAGQVSHGPKGAIGLLAMWDYGYTGAATPLTMFSIERDGDVPVQDNVNARHVVRDATYTDPVGVYDMNAIVTRLHSLPGDSEKNEIPTGTGFRFVQASSQLNPAKTAWLHIPARTEDEVDTLVGRNVEDVEGVKLINAAAKSGKGMTSNAAALEGVIIARRSSGDFEVVPGRVHAIGIAPTTHVPAPVAAAAARAASAGDAETAGAAAGKAAGAFARWVPGWASAKRGQKSAAVQGFRARLRGK